MRDLESAMGRRLGDGEDPLLVSVRSGAKFSMPGMMETVLNIGLNDASVDGLARTSGSERFAYDSYRRLLQMYGATVLGIDSAAFADRARRRPRRERGVERGRRPGCRRAARARGDVPAHHRASDTGPDFPQDPHAQLVGRGARGLRVLEHRASACSTAARSGSPRTSARRSTCRSWCSATAASSSGSGVCFTRDPSTGHRGVYGDYLQNAQGEDVVAGIRNTVPLADLAELDKVSYDALLEVMASLETHYRDLCDIEFTIEDGRLWILQTRVGKRTPRRRSGSPTPWSRRASSTPTRQYAGSPAPSSRS